MTVEEALYSHLAAASGLTSLIGDRITPLSRQQKAGGTTARPALTYELVDTETARDFDGNVGVDRNTFDLRSWGVDYPQAKAVAQQVRAALATLRGKFTDITIAGTTYLNERAFDHPDVNTVEISQQYTIVVCV